VGLAFAAFVSLGLPDGVLGVAWPSVRADLGLPLPALGALLAAATAGYLVSAAASGLLVERRGVGWLLATSSLLMVASAGAYALAPALPVVLLAGVLAGLGSGAIDAGLNAHAAVRFPPGLVTWLHASYGVGATLGPLLMTAMVAGGPGWRWGYGTLALVLGGMALAFARTRRAWDTPGFPRPAAPRGAGPGGPAGGWPAVASGLAFFFVYTGLEVTAGQWSFTLLSEGRGLDPAAAGGWVAAFWGGLTAGRLVSGVLAARVPPARLLQAATRGAPLPAALLWLDVDPAVSGAALAALGFLLGPVYPLAVAATPARVGAAAAPRVIGVQVAAAYLGTAALPGLAGVLSRAHGLEAIGAVLTGAALGVLGLQEWTARLARRLARAPAPPAVPAARP
jgi:fucose permease